MNVIVYKRRGLEEVDVYKTFPFAGEHDTCSDKEEKFAHFMWKELVKQEFGSEYLYISDWSDYNKTYPDNQKYRGEGIYREGSIMFDIESLYEGFSEITIGDVLYFIEK